MGKKPVLAMIGLVWAGIALTGCGTCGSCCRNCPNNKYNATPAFGARNTKTDAEATPTMIGEAKPAVTPEAGAARMTETPAAPGAPKPPMIEQTSGTTTGPTGVAPATPASFSRPTTQSSLRPTDDRGLSAAATPAAPGAPRTLDDGFMSRANGGESRTMTVPPRPVTPAPAAPSMTPTMTPNTAAPSSLPGRELPSMSGSGTPPPPPPAAAFDSGTPPPLPPSK